MAAAVPEEIQVNISFGRLKLLIQSFYQVRHAPCGLILD